MRDKLEAAKSVRKVDSSVEEVIEIEEEQEEEDEDIEEELR